MATARAAFFPCSVVRTQLTDPWLAVEFGNVTSQENQIAAAQEGYKSCYRRREFWKCDVESLKLS